MNSRWLALLASAIALGIAVAAAAPSGGRFEITTSTIDGGGATSAGGGSSVTDTIAQPDPGLFRGGSFLLQGGLWTRQTPDSLFKDSFEDGVANSQEERQ